MANRDLAPGALAKPAKGTALLARRATRQSRVTAERTQKQIAKARDGHRCRWPHCAYRDVRLESAHLYNKAMGGDHGLRSRADQLITLCLLHHQGPRSLHSGDLRIEPQTAREADGPVAFFELREGRLVVVAIEQAIGGPYVRA